MEKNGQKKKKKERLITAYLQCIKYHNCQEELKLGLIHNKENENVQLAKEMLSLGLDLDQICQVTNLKKEELQKLLDETKNQCKIEHL